MESVSADGFFLFCRNTCNFRRTPRDLSARGFIGGCILGRGRLNVFEFLAVGFQVALQPENLLAVTIGVLVGMSVGVLPGLGPAATIAILLPLTYAMEPTSAIIMLAGIYYGSMYGGTVTSVLLRLPGEAAAVVTIFDGYPMAQQGRAGAALGIAAIGSAIGGMLSVVGLIFFAPPLAQAALAFGPPEFTVLAVMGLLLVTYLGTTSPLRSLVVACAGLLFATVGLDLISGATRFDFGSTAMLGGLDFVAIVMGIFGIGEILYNLEKSETGNVIKRRVGKVWPTRADWKLSRGPILRGSGLGFFLGALPGGGGMISSMASYAIEKRRAKDPTRFGKGAIEGVAGPETANNAGSTSAFIPMLVLGIPPNAVLALVFGALLVQGVVPGPQLVNEHPDIFWGVVASMVVGNLILLALNIPLIGVFVQLLRVRMSLLAGVIMVVALIGVYTINNSIFDMWVMVAFGLIGYLMRKLNFDAGPLVLALILGPLVERSFRQSLLMSGGEPTIFLTRPLSGGIIAFVVVVALVTSYARRRSRRRSLQPDGVPSKT